mgnify:CR=1 FL=1
MFCFKLRFSNELVKYNRESDYFSGPIILATNEVTAYSPTPQLQLERGTLGRRKQQHIVLSGGTKSLRFDLAELVADASSFFEL